MDDHRFDDLTRQCSAAPDRRTLVRGLAAALAGLAAPSLAAWAKKKGCPDGRKRCNGRCISRKKCCRNRDCGNGNGNVCCNGDCTRGDCCNVDDCCAGGDCGADRSLLCCDNRCVRGACCPGKPCGEHCTCRVAVEGDAFCSGDAVVLCAQCPAAGCPANQRCAPANCPNGVTAACRPLCAS